MIRALGEAGLSVELITIGNLRKHYISSSCYVNKHHALKDVKELASYLLYGSIPADGNREIIISCADAVTEHLNLFRDRLSKRYILPGVPEQGKMVELMDKTTMIAMAAKRGVNAPMVWTLPVDKDKVTFPCITKAHVSSHGGKSDIVICRNKNQFESFLSENTDDLFA